MNSLAVLPDRLWPKRLADPVDSLENFYIARAKSILWSEFREVELTAKQARDVVKWARPQH